MLAGSLHPAEDLGKLPPRPGAGAAGCEARTLRLQEKDR